MNIKKNHCQKTENLRDKPASCSPEQILQCHGEVQEHPCVAASGCEQPEKLKSTPQECSQEQIRQCHGENTDHPCDDIND